jgi:hypothetical protein
MRFWCERAVGFRREMARFEDWEVSLERMFRRRAGRIMVAMFE